MPRTSDKRDRLARAGRELFYERGYKQTSLAHIADAANVPVGNVYYYFKTKEMLADAVIDRRVARFKKQSLEWKTLDDPRDRLVAYLDLYLNDKDRLTQFGCPNGSLSQELNKDRSNLGKKAAMVLRLHTTWIADQLWELHLDNAQEQAMSFISSLQGAILLANSQDDPEILNNEIIQLKAWVLGI